MNVEVGGGGEKKKTLELENIEKIKKLLQIKNTGFKNKSHNPNQNLHA